ncbi:MAG TPA: MFS transporter [Cellvibrio sp.]|nr:MFS transporter [Cellvibrio sp.]
MQSSPLPFERRVVMSLAALYTFRMFGLFLLLPVLALYGTQYEGNTPFLLGVALGAYGASQALLQIPFGVLSDRIGRKPIIVAGLLIFIAGSVIAAQAHSVYELIIGRILQGGGAISGVVMALLTDLTSEENRTKAMATVGASIGISFSVAMTIGPMMANWAGVGSIFWVTAALGVIGIFILLLLVPNVQQAPRRKQEAGAVPGLLWQTLKHPELMRLNLGIFALHFVLMANFMVLPQILEQQLHITRSHHGMVYFPMLVVAFAIMLPFVILAEKRRKIKPVFLAAIGLLAATELGLIAVTPNLYLTLAAIFFFFVAFNVLEATLPSMVSKIAPAGAKGTATGIYSTSQVIGVSAGGAVGGWLLQQYGMEAVLALSALFSLLWLAAAWSMKPPRFLASVLIPLGQHKGELIADKLRAVEGVAEVLIVTSENTAYLKVDQRLVDRKALQAIVAGPA